MFGLAVVSGSMFGAASAALGANGDNLVLGQNNVANALTRLTGSVPGAQMEVQNNDPGANDTALSLKVQPGEPPMKVLSGAKVENLNADELDGLDPSQIKGARPTPSWIPMMVRVVRLASIRPRLRGSTRCSVSAPASTA